MVWQFGRFEGAPYLEDYVKSKINFQIMFPTDVPERCKSEDPTYLRQFGMSFLTHMPEDFYRMIDPVFEFPKGSIPHSDMYSLLFTGEKIVRQLMSDVKESEHSNVTYVTPKKVGFADFEDLKYVGEYASQRISQIPLEVRLIVQQVESDLPRYALESRGNYSQELAIVDWNDFVKVIENCFKQNFVKYIHKKFDEKKLEPIHCRELIALVSNL